MVLGKVYQLIGILIITQGFLGCMDRLPSRQGNRSQRPTERQSQREQVAPSDRVSPSFSSSLEGAEVIPVYDSAFCSSTHLGRRREVAASSDSNYTDVRLQDSDSSQDQGNVGNGPFANLSRSDRAVISSQIRTHLGTEQRSQEEINSVRDTVAEQLPGGSISSYAAMYMSQDDEEDEETQSPEQRNFRTYLQQQHVRTHVVVPACTRGSVDSSVDASAIFK